MPRLFAAALALSALVWTAPAYAAAPQTLAPPGKAGANQYVETIPTARGNVRPPAPGAAAPVAGARAGRAGANSGSQGVLARFGPDGRAAAGFAAATAQAGAATARHAPVSLPSGSAGSALGDLLGSSDSGGLGLWLPLLMAASLLAAIAVLLAKLRRRPTA